MDGVWSNDGKENSVAKRLVWLVVIVKEVGKVLYRTWKS